MKEDLKLPCIDCICLPICKYIDRPKNRNIGPFITSLGNKCSTLRDYFFLFDLGLDARKINDDWTMAQRKHITQPLCQRILALCEYMNWNEFTLDRTRILAQGLIPEGEE